MRILFLFLSVMLVPVLAEADLCSPAWLSNASGSAARALIRTGADVDEECNTNGNRPLHQALLNDRVDAEVIRALIEAGGDLYAENIHREMPMEYAQDRFDRMRATYLPGSSIYRAEQALYSRIFGGDPSSDAAVQQAHDQLCDLNWWRSSASGAV